MVAFSQIYIQVKFYFLHVPTHQSFKVSKCQSAKVNSIHAIIPTCLVSALKYKFLYHCISIKQFISCMSAYKAGNMYIFLYLISKCQSAKAAKRQSFKVSKRQSFKVPKCQSVKAPKRPTSERSRTKASKHDAVMLWDCDALML